MTAFKFELWNLGTTKLAEFNPTGARWDMNIKDASGSLTFTVPQGDVPPELDVGLVDVLIAQDGAYVWRGQVLGRQFTVDGAAFQQQFTAVGLFELLADRYIPAGTSYTAASMNMVINNIMPDIQLQTNGELIIGQAVPVDGAFEKYDASPYFTYPDVTITKTYDQPTSAKQAIEELAGIYPFDIQMHPVPFGRYGLENILTGTAISYLVMFPRGADTGYPTVTLAHGDEVSRITGVDNLAPGGPFCNQADVYPSGGGVPTTRSDATLMGTHRRRDKVLTSTGGNDYADTLIGIATTTLWDGKPRTMPTVTVRPGVNLLELGDNVHLFSEQVPEVNGRWLVAGRSVTWPTMDDPDTFQQELTLEPYNPRTVDPFA